MRSVSGFQWNNAFSDSEGVGKAVQVAMGEGGREPGRGSLRRVQHLPDGTMRAIGAMRTADAMEPVSGQIE